MITIEEDRTQARIDRLLEVLRAAESDLRRSYARVLEVVAERSSRHAQRGTPQWRCPRGGHELFARRGGAAESGRAAPRLVVTMRLSDLIDGLGTAALDTSGQLSAAEACRLACDSRVVPMVLGTDSMPLDVGRQHRLATAAIRDALAQRDKGCAFPGRDRPPRYCEAHHIVSWLDGGETKLPNMYLLCEYHHTIVHRQGWHIRLDRRGQSEFIPLKTVDPTRTPLHDPLQQ